MDIVDRLARRIAESKPEVFESVAHHGLSELPVIQLATRIASYRHALIRKLQENPTARENAKELLQSVPPLDFTVACFCLSCKDRFKEWAAAKNGEML